MAGRIADALTWFGLESGAVDPAAVRAVERTLGVRLPGSLHRFFEVPGLGEAVAGVYSAQPHFPAEPRLLEGGLVGLMTENQGVCAWGVPTDAGDDPPVLVSGDLLGGPGTAAYTADVDSLITTAAWDHRCLTGTPLVQAQAAPLDPATLGFLRRGYRVRTTTYGWPSPRTLRFQRTGVHILLWPADDQCDWWISGHPRALVTALRELRGYSDLRSSLWSNDEPGLALLAELGNGEAPAD